MEEIFNSEWEQGNILEPKGTVMIYAKHESSPVILVGYHRNGRSEKYEAIVENSHDFEELRKFHKDNIRLKDFTLPPFMKLRNAIDQYKKILHVNEDVDKEIYMGLHFYDFKHEIVEQELENDVHAAKVCLYLDDLINGAKQKKFQELDVLRMKKLTKLLPEKYLPHLFRKALSLDKEKRLEVAGEYLDMYKKVIGEKYMEAASIRDNIERRLTKEEQKLLLTKISA